MVHLPNPSFEPKLTGAAPGHGCRVGRCPQKTAHLCPKTAPPPLFFFCRNALKTEQQMEMVATLHMHLDFLVTKSPFVPSNSTICEGNDPNG